jgi:hypothetical protein
MLYEIKCGSAGLGKPSSTNIAAVPKWEITRLIMDINNIKRIKVDFSSPHRGDGD